MSEEETRACSAAWEEGGGWDATSAPPTAAAAPLDRTAGEVAGEMEALLLACDEEAAKLRAKIESMAKILALMAKRTPPHAPLAPG